eukprot:TRINITY_DN51631_c0_g1_i1.p1 TRINITY_DN51631_c0_g1~~TRINITY_DN51631_c0_g1_i1.p1  ORF type:complete len:429 (+),score=123.15 TRINITY_DN51631_c0_g1_i1:135-1421(+)
MALSQIRRFQEERDAWDTIRTELEAQLEEAQEARSSAEQGLVKLADEVERLRDEQRRIEEENERLRIRGSASPSSGSGGGAGEDTEEKVRSHHQKNLSLLRMLDTVRQDLQQERDKSRSLERRVNQAETASRKLSRELARASPADLDLTSSRLQLAGLDVSRKGEQDFLGSTSRDLDVSRQEVLSLEDENIRLREELNREKKRVIDLKQAAIQRKAAWKEEVDKISEDLSMKERLEEEVLHLKRAHQMFLEDRRTTQEREAKSQRDYELLQQELRRVGGQVPSAALESSTSLSEQRDLDTLSATVSKQLVAVEQELQQQVQRTAQHVELIELFLKHALLPLKELRSLSQHVIAAGEAGAWTRQVPPLYDAASKDTRANLVGIVAFLRFMADLLQERQTQKQTQRPAFPTIEDTTGYAKAWLREQMAPQ